MLVEVSVVLDVPSTDPGPAEAYALNVVETSLQEAEMGDLVRGVRSNVVRS